MRAPLYAGHFIRLIPKVSTIEGLHCIYRGSLCACPHLHNLFGEVRVVHVEDGGLDVSRCWESLDLNQDVVGPALV